MTSIVVDHLETRGIDIKSTGNDNALINCPFHDDRTPSLWINLKTGVFKCLAGSCGQTGSFAALIAELDHISISQARAKLGLDNLAVDREIRALEDDLNDDEDENLLPYSWESFQIKFVSALSVPRAMEYLQKSRKLESNTITQFGLRFCLQKGSKYAERVAIPIRGVDGRLWTYAARRIDGGKPKTRKPRRASNVLFGLYEILQTNPSLPLPYLMIVEGEFDAMYLQQFGILAVAAMGTSGITALQRALLVEYSSSVVLSYDGDLAGRRAMYGYRNRKTGKRRVGDLRQCKSLLPTTAVELSEGSDPNTLSASEVKMVYASYLGVLCD